MNAKMNVVSLSGESWDTEWAELKGLAALATCEWRCVSCSVSLKKKN